MRAGIIKVIWCIIGWSGCAVAFADDCEFSAQLFREYRSQCKATGQCQDDPYYRPILLKDCGPERTEKLFADETQQRAEKEIPTPRAPPQPATPSTASQQTAKAPDCAALIRSLPEAWDRAVREHTFFEGARELAHKNWAKTFEATQGINTASWILKLKSMNDDLQLFASLVCVELKKKNPSFTSACAVPGLVKDAVTIATSNDPAPLVRVAVKRLAKELAPNANVIVPVESYLEEPIKTAQMEKEHDESMASLREQFRQLALVAAEANRGLHDSETRMRSLKQLEKLITQQCSAQRQGPLILNLP